MAFVRVNRFDYPAGARTAISRLTHAASLPMAASLPGYRRFLMQVFDDESNTGMTLTEWETREQALAGGIRGGSSDELYERIQALGVVITGVQAYEIENSLLDNL